MGGWAAGEQDEFAAAVEFLFVVRCFLHYRHERDDNTLDWQAQDAGGEEGDRAGPQAGARGRRGPEIDAAYWMRFYFRHARSVERRLTQMLDVVPTKQRAGRWSVPGRSVFGKTRRQAESATVGFRVENGRAILDAAGGPEGDPAQDPDVVLRAVCGDGADGMRAGPRQRRADVAGAAAALGTTWKKGRRCGGICGRFCWGACGQDAAGDACAGDSGAADPGVPRHRCAGDSRCVPPVHGG